MVGLPSVELFAFGPESSARKLVLLCRPQVIMLKLEANARFVAPFLIRGINFFSSRLLWSVVLFGFIVPVLGFNYDMQVFFFIRIDISC